MFVSLYIDLPCICTILTKQNKCIFDDSRPFFHIISVLSISPRLFLTWLFLSVYQKFSDIKNLSLQFWLVAFAIMFFYNGVFPFMADARYMYKAEPVCTI